MPYKSQIKVPEQSQWLILSKISLPHQKKEGEKAVTFMEFDIQWRYDFLISDFHFQ